MRKILALLLILFSFKLVGAELFDIETSSNCGELAPPPAVFCSKELSTFIPVLPKVNVITGEYCEEEVDLVVAGIEPLSYRRFYGHQGHKDPAYGHWRINPECFMVFNFDLTKHFKRRFDTLVGAGERNGSYLLYEQRNGNQFSFDAAKHTSFTHSDSVGQSHPLNTCVTYQKIQREDQFGWYNGTLKSGNGTQRHFCTNLTVWPENKVIFGTFPVPPYQARVTEERLPNGNIIQYDYIDFNDEEFRTRYYLLTSITAYNASRTQVLSSLQVHYDRDKKKYGKPIKRIHLTGSDGRGATLFHERREVQAYNKRRGKERQLDSVLNRVETAWKPIQHYSYRWEKAKTYFDHPYLFSTNDTSVLETTYDLTSKKVAAQSAPIGPNGEMLPIARYQYQPDHTIVYDGENHKTLFRFNSEQRITAVETYEEDQPVCTEKSEWEFSTGNLLCKTIEDLNGQPLYIAKYIYDKNHNVIEEQIGDGTNWDLTYRTFSDDGFNLKLTESDRLDKLISFTYIPETNLLTSEIVYEKDQILKRAFYFYDTELSSIQVKTIVDDGHSLDPNDLAGVTYRKIIEVEPKRETPCLGFPQTVCEKTLDAYGNEILLSKIEYTYHPSGKIESEKHYDAQNTYRYSILNEYDANERVIATTDALGQRTTFEYDANFNQISEQGPYRIEQSYDKVNRPIQKKEWQTDGSVLITEKRYDRCSRLIATIDPCGFETSYAYNAQGLLTILYHPDGAIERKEYDPLGNCTAETDANGYTTLTTYNFRNQPTAIVHPDGKEEYFTYQNGSGNLVASLDANGTQEVYTYDIFDNLIQTKIYSPQGALLAVTTATYSPFHKLSETDAEGATTTYSYDFAGRLITKQIGEKITSYTYDALGNTYSTQEGTIVTLTTHDERGQLLQEKIIDSKNEYFKQTYTYDKSGNRTFVRTCAGTSQTEYNAQGEPTQITDPLGNKTNINYSYTDYFIKTTTNPKGIQTVEIHDARGRVVDLQVKNPSGKTIQRSEKRYDLAGNQTHAIEYAFEGLHLRETLVHEWIYGPDGRIEQLIEADLKKTHYQYDEKGRLITIIKPDGSKLQHTYDALGRLSRYFGKDIDYHYTYDKNGQLVKLEDKIQNTLTERSYDIYGNIIEEKQASGLTISSDYDPYGKRITLHLPNGSEVHSTYKGPYLETISYNDCTHTYSSRNLAGKPTLIHLPNQTGSLSITWDPNLRCQQLRSSHYQADYIYDSLDNLTNYTFTDPLGAQKNTYAYDDLNQLISDEEHVYNYDSLFNRTAKDEQTYNLNSLCQVTSDGQKKYTYDTNGNLILDGNSYYEYDSLDRLIKVSTSGFYTTFTYDGFNRRISKNGQLYIWDDKKEIGMSINGRVQELRILGEGLGAEIGAAVFIEIGGYTYFPLHDVQGSLITLIQPNGNSCGCCRYTPFGEQTTKDHTSPWRFASKRYDPETDLIYFGRRYYSPNLGRWITADPQGFDDGPNLYAYVHNSPMITLDLHGLYSCYNTWTGMKNFGIGVGRQSWDMFSGIGHAAGSLGSWMAADSLYESGDPSLFHAKSQAAYDGWNALGSNFRNAPLRTTGELLVPGIMAAMHNPTSAEAWGRASVDIGLMGFSATKIGRSATNFGKVGIAEDLSVLKKTGYTATNFPLRPSDTLLVSSRQIQAKFKHAVDFGISGTYNKFNAAKFSSSINQHINNPGVKAIPGTYRSKVVIHYLDSKTGLNIVSSPSGEFISGWKLNPIQLKNVREHGGL